MFEPGLTYGPEFLAAPHKFMADMHNSYPPVFYNVGPFGNMWSVIKHEDALLVLRHAELFSNEDATPFPRDPADWFYFIPIEIDPPDHRKYRNIVDPVISPQGVLKLEDRIRALANELIDGFIEQGECEFDEVLGRRTCPWAWRRASPESPPPQRGSAARRTSRRVCAFRRSGRRSAPCRRRGESNPLLLENIDPRVYMLGGVGEGFKVAQARLGGGRIHHAMRTVGKCHRAIGMMLERAVSRRTRGRRLGDHQMVQAKIADSLIELEQFRLLVLKTAWLIDEIEAGRLPHGAARNHIGMCKVAMAVVWMNVIGRALEVHGSLAISLDLPLANWFGGGMGLAFADGPTDVHKSQLARAHLAGTTPVEGIFPSEHIPTRTAAALRRYPPARG